MKTKTSKTIVILYTVTAILWTFNAVSKFFESVNTTGDKIITMVVALIWTICAVTQYMRYRDEKES